MSQKILRNISVAALILCVLASCSSVKKVVLGEKKTELILTIKAEKDVNPDDNGRSSLVYLNLYELRTGKTFPTVSYINLLQGGPASLGVDLVSNVRLDAILPGSERQEKMVLDATTNHLGVSAELVQYENINTKVLIDIVPNKTNNVVLVVGKYGLKYSLKD
jgi:type VI secretion system protein VasD